MVGVLIGMLDGPTPLQSAWPMAFIAMAVESECLLYSLCVYTFYCRLVNTCVTIFLCSKFHHDLFSSFQFAAENKDNGKCIGMFILCQCRILTEISG